MPTNTQWVFLVALCIAIAGIVRMRYLRIRETGETRSATPLRDYDDLWERFRTRVLWCFLPAFAVAIFLWFARQSYTVAILTVIVAGSIALGGAIFDHCLLQAWKKNPPKPPTRE